MTITTIWSIKTRNNVVETRWAVEGSQVELMVFGSSKKHRPKTPIWVGHIFPIRTFFVTEFYGRNLPKTIASLGKPKLDVSKEKIGRKIRGITSPPFKNPIKLLLMAEILHQLIGRISQYLRGFILPRWCRISAINSTTGFPLIQVGKKWWFSVCGIQELWSCSLVDVVGSQRLPASHLPEL